MKKILAIILALAMVFALAACGGGGVDASKLEEILSTLQSIQSKVDSLSAGAPAAAPAEAPAPEPAGDEVLTVGIAMPTNSLERWNRDGAYLQEQFEAAGYNTILKYSDNKNDQQNNDIQNMISDGVDLLVITAIDSDGLSQTLAEATEKGIPVVAYDRLINNTDALTVYVSFDNYTVGVLQGTFVKDTLDLDNAEGPFNIEFTAGDPADTNAGYFFSGAVDVLQPYLDEGKLVIPSGQSEFEQVATEQWNTENALNRFQNILASYYADGTILDVALCSNDSTALGVAKAITDDYAGGNSPIITGQDGDVPNLQNIVNGIQTMTVYKNVADEAAVTLEVAKAILEGKTLDASLTGSLSAEAAFDTESYNNGVMDIPSYLLVPYVITADNLDLLVDTGLYQWDADHTFLEAK